MNYSHVKTCNHTMQNNGTEGRTPAQMAAAMENLSRVRLHNPVNSRRGINEKIEGGLVGDVDAVRINSRETPAHRTMVNMAAAGYTNREIALFTGYAPATVSNAIKQPHARQYLINEAKKTVQEELKELLASQAIPSVQTLVSVRDDVLAAAPARVTAANSILDRFLGKPTQPITNDAKSMSDLSDEELRAQVASELQQIQTN